MSHKASCWLAEIPAEALTGAQFRVLFHLCDAHNSKRDPETACFPRQDRLREATGLSNGGLNKALNALEAAGFIRRRRTTEPGSAVQRTYYILGCDLEKGQEQTPLSGDRANSTFCEANSTFQGGKLHFGGVSYEPVSNRKEEPRAGAGTRAGARVGEAGNGTTSAPPKRQVEKPRRDEKRLAPAATTSPDPNAALVRLADWIKSERFIPPSAVSNTQRDALLQMGLVDEATLRARQIY